LWVLSAAFIRFVAGPSPLLLFDTAQEETFVRWCLERGLCPLFGGPTTAEGFWQGGAWIFLRVLSAEIGLSLDHVHQALQVMDAAGIVMVAVTGALAGGRAAGVLSAVTAALLYLQLDVQVDSVHNSRLLFFPGCVTLLLVAAGAGSGRLFPMVIAAAVSGVAAGSHVAGGTLVAGVACAAALRPGNRAAAVAAVLSTWAATVLLLSPGLWLTELSGWLAEGLPAAGAAPRGVPRFVRIEWLAAGIAATVTVFLWPRGSVRRRLWTAVCAFAFGAAAPGVLAMMHGSASAAAKYLAHLAPAAAVGLAVPPLVIAAGAVRWLEARAGGPAHAYSENRRRAVRAALPAALVLLVFFALARAVGEIRWYDHSRPNHGDLRVVAAHFKDNRGWSLRDLFRHLKGPFDFALLSELAAAWPLSEYEASKAPAMTGNVHVNVVPEDRIPFPLSASCRVLRARGRHAVVVTDAKTAIDWGRFTICSRPEGARELACVESGINLSAAEPLRVFDRVPGMPKVLPGEARELVLKAPMKVPGDGADWVVSMPRRPDSCGGRIVGTPEGAGGIPQDGRRAVIPAGAGGELVLSWRIGAKECPVDAFSGFVPFFIETEHETAAILEAMAGGDRRP
jgi:hypothetical protein